MVCSIISTKTFVFCLIDSVTDLRNLDANQKCMVLMSKEPDAMEVRVLQQTADYFLFQYSGGLDNASLVNCDRDLKCWHLS